MGIGAIIYYFTRAESTFQTESWKESYAPTDKGPYGTYVLKELLDTTGMFESFIQIDGQIEEQLIDNENENDIYFFIGVENHMSEDAFLELLNFVGAGNTAFISARNMPKHMLDFFFLDLNSVYEYSVDSSESFKLLSKPFTENLYGFKYINNNKPVTHQWSFFVRDNVVHQKSAPIILGTSAEQHTNFIEVQYNDGSFFFHSNPYLFSNISLFRFDGFNYTEDLIHHLPYGKIQWDIYNLRHHYSSVSETNSGGPNSSPKKRSVFQFIFQHTALIWAFGILCLTAFLFAVFHGKRRQNIVQAIELKENSSLNHIETVSSLYLQEGKHNKLIQLQQKSFIEFIGNHYYIRSKLIDDKYIQNVTLKSGIETEKIIAIFSEMETLGNQKTVNDQELIKLQQKIEHFYKTCK